jgi:hypothetical protein
VSAISKIKVDFSPEKSTFFSNATSIGTIFAFFIVQNHTISLRLENSTVTFNITEANFLYQWRAALLYQKSCNQQRSADYSELEHLKILHNRNFSQQNGSAIFKINIRSLLNR